MSNFLSERKCAECGADLAVTFQQLRGFYVNDNGEVVEDDNLEIMGPPEFVIHCSNDTEDAWVPENLTVDQEEELSKWEDKVLDEIKEKFFQGE